METPVASCPVSRPVKFTNTTTLWGSTKVVTHDRLFGVDKVPGIIKNDCITVIIDVTLFEEPETVRVSETTNKQSPAIYEAFLQRQLQMLCSEQHRQAADFTLYSNDGNDFHVNRFFLMAHSPFFAALLTGDSPEKRQAKYEFPDLDGNSVEIMLGYLYGSYVDKIHSGNAEKVLDMADKYQVTGLRVVCEKAMAENINAGNVVEYQVLARQKNLDVLMNAAFQFIANYQSVHSKGSK
ncbi:speckle-type POZ protein-like [Paramacrobiotus metropolitanus]|uniref:speckle-type POZ protein-like n=1 Tax=Paramacrobiotus metropolitanus TaxID=2943436 RepID=UPI00244604A5|nr:speckle-type POZ protein-like [Paramacrobiotus metropolitanus]